MRGIASTLALCVFASASIPCGVGLVTGEVAPSHVAAGEHAAGHASVGHGHDHGAASPAPGHAAGESTVHGTAPMRGPAESALRLEPTCPCGCDGGNGGSAASPTTRLPAALFACVPEPRRVDRAPASAPTTASLPIPPLRSIERVPIV